LPSFVGLDSLRDGLMRLMHLCVGCWVARYPDNSAMLQDGIMLLEFVYVKY